MNEIIGYLKKEMVQSNDSLDPEGKRLMRELRKITPVKDLVLDALLREFIYQEDPIKLTEEEVLEGFRKFKIKYQELLPYIF